MDDIEKRNLVNSLISEVRIHDECPEDGNWFKSMKFRLPVDADKTADVYDEETWNGFTVMLADLFMKYVLVVETERSGK